MKKTSQTENNMSQEMSGRKCSECGGAGQMYWLVPDDEEGPDCVYCGGSGYDET